MTVAALAVFASICSFALGLAARPRRARRLVEIEIAQAQTLIAALRTDIAALPATIYSSDSRRITSSRP
jgi:hypothetical protein